MRARNNLVPQEAARTFTGHAPTVWRATLVAKWHITARLAVNALPGQHKPPAHDISEMIRFVTENQIFGVG